MVTRPPLLWWFNPTFPRYSCCLLIGVLNHREKQIAPSSHPLNRVIRPKLKISSNQFQPKFHHFLPASVMSHLLGRRLVEIHLIEILLWDEFLFFFVNDIWISSPDDVSNQICRMFSAKRPIFEQLDAPRRAAASLQMQDLIPSAIAGGNEQQVKTLPRWI